VATSGIDDPLDSEPASGRGLLAQGMRHLEAMTRLHAEALGQLVITQQRTISRLAEVNEAGEERRLKAVETAEAMMSDRQERTLKVQESADRTSMLASVLETVTPVGPAIIDYLTGAGEKKANDILGMHRELLAGFAKDPDRLEKLLAFLSPEERALFEAIFDSVPSPPGASEGGPDATLPGGGGSPAPGPSPPKGGPPPSPPPVSPGGAGPNTAPPRGPGPRPAHAGGAVPRPPGPTPPPRRSRAGGNP
jgi:hypothetical protein